MDKLKGLVTLAGLIALCWLIATTYPEFFPWAFAFLGDLAQGVLDAIRSNTESGQQP